MGAMDRPRNGLARMPSRAASARRARDPALRGGASGRSCCWRRAWRGEETTSPAARTRGPSCRPASILRADDRQRKERPRVLLRPLHTAGPAGRRPCPSVRPARTSPGGPDHTYGKTTSTTPKNDYIRSFAHKTGIFSRRSPTRTRQPEQNRRCGMPIAGTAGNAPGGLADTPEPTGERGRPVPYGRSAVRSRESPSMPEACPAFAPDRSCRGAASRPQARRREPGGNGAQPQRDPRLRAADRPGGHGRHGAGDRRRCGGPARLSRDAARRHRRSSSGAR